MFDLASFDTDDDGDADDVDEGAKVAVINPEDFGVWAGSTELLDGVACKGDDTVNGPPPCTTNGSAGWVGKTSGVTP